MKAEYKNKLRSKKIIREAVITLLKKHKTLETITITEVVKEANINRGTFYNHYNNIIEVVEEIKFELFNQLNSALKYTVSTNNLDNINIFFDSITDFLKQNEELYKSIVPHISKDILYEFANKLISEEKHHFSPNKNIDINEIELYILAYGLAGTYIQYFENKLPFSLEQLKDASVQTIYKFLNISFNK